MTDWWQKEDLQREIVVLRNERNEERALKEEALRHLAATKEEIARCKAEFRHQLEESERLLAEERARSLHNALLSEIHVLRDEIQGHDAALNAMLLRFKEELDSLRADLGQFVDERTLYQIEHSYSQYQRLTEAAVKNAKQMAVERKEHSVKRTRFLEELAKHRTTQTMTKTLIHEQAMQHRLEINDLVADLQDVRGEVVDAKKTARNAGLIEAAPERELWIDDDDALEAEVNRLAAQNEANSAHLEQRAGLHKQSVEVLKQGIAAAREELKRLTEIAVRSKDMKVDAEKRGVTEVDPATGKTVLRDDKVQHRMRLKQAELEAARERHMLEDEHERLTAEIRSLQELIVENHRAMQGASERRGLDHLLGQKAALQRTMEEREEELASLNARIAKELAPLRAKVDATRHELEKMRVLANVTAEELEAQLKEHAEYEKEISGQVAALREQEAESARRYKEGTDKLNSEEARLKEDLIRARRGIELMRKMIDQNYSRYKTESFMMGSPPGGRGRSPTRSPVRGAAQEATATDPERVEQMRKELRAVQGDLETLNEEYAQQRRGHGDFSLEDSAQNTDLNWSRPISIRNYDTARKINETVANGRSGVASEEPEELRHELERTREEQRQLESNLAKVQRELSLARQGLGDDERIRQLEEDRERAHDEAALAHAQMAEAQEELRKSKREVRRLQAKMGVQLSPDTSTSFSHLDDTSSPRPQRPDSGDVVSLNKQLREREDETTRLREDIARLQGDLDAFMRSSQRCIQCDALRREVSTLQAEADNRAAELDRRVAELDALRAPTRDDVRCDTCVDRQREIDSLRAELGVQKEKVRLLSAEAAPLKKDGALRKSELERAETASRGSTGGCRECDERRRDVDRLTAEVDRLRRAAPTTSGGAIVPVGECQNCDVLRDEVARARRGPCPRCTDRERHIANLERELALHALPDNTEGLRRDVLMLKEQLEEERARKPAREIDSLKREIHHLQNQLESERRRPGREATALKREIKDLQDEMEEVRNHQPKEIAALRREIKILKMDPSSSARRRAIDKEREELLAEVAKLRKEMRDKPREWDRERKKLQDQIAELEEEMRGLKQSEATSRTSGATAKHEAAAAKEELEKTKEALLMKESQVEAANRRAREAEARADALRQAAEEKQADEAKKTEEAKKAAAKKGGAKKRGGGPSRGGRRGGAAGSRGRTSATNSVNGADEYEEGVEDGVSVGEDAEANGVHGQADAEDGAEPEEELSPEAKRLAEENRRIKEQNEQLQREFAENQHRMQNGDAPLSYRGLAPRHRPYSPMVHLGPPLSLYTPSDSPSVRDAMLVPSDAASQSAVSYRSNRTLDRERDPLSGIPASSISIDNVSR